MTPENVQDCDLSFLCELYNIIVDRRDNPPQDRESYVNKIFNHRKGINKILEKVAEECSETVLAVKDDDREEIIYETSDLLFHLMMMLVSKGIQLDDIIKELQRRHSDS